MSIKKIVVYPCKGHYKGYKHVFEYVDENRLVDINITGEIICKIKKRLDFYSKSTNENIKKYLSDWNRWLKSYIVPDGIDISFTSTTFQHFVKLNYELLKPNKVLTHNEALFLILGLNAHELGRGIKNFPKLDCAEEPFHLAELELWRTEQNKALKESAYFTDGKITSEDLVILATKENSFFTELKTIDGKPAKKERQLTKETRENINNIAKELMKNSPTLKKPYLAEDITKPLFEKHKINLKPATILRDYLAKYPNF